MVARRDAARRRQHLARRDRQEDERRAGSSERPTARRRRASDYRFIDRLDYMLNGTGFIYDRVRTSGWSTSRPARRRRLTDGPAAGHRAGVVARRHADRLRVEPPSRRRPASPADRNPRRRRRDRCGHGRHRAVRARSSPARRGCPTAGRSRRSGIGSRAGAGSRNDIWLFAADGSDATPNGGRNLSATPRPDAGLGDEQRRHARRGDPPVPSRRRGAGSTFTAPIDGRLRAVAHRRRPTAGSSG